ncbi:hypothetical protein Rs2_15237 [Raphanus sativus]|nr:hypothetical protein Rs2_15237 [Raphanus sativus]
MLRCCHWRSPPSLAADRMPRHYQYLNLILPSPVVASVRAQSMETSIPSYYYLREEDEEAGWWWFVERDGDSRRSQFSTSSPSVLISVCGSCVDGGKQWKRREAVSGSSFSVGDQNHAIQKPKTSLWDSSLRLKCGETGIL